VRCIERQKHILKTNKEKINLFTPLKAYNVYVKGPMLRDF
jgi:hypothetical protein